MRKRNGPPAVIDYSKYRPVEVVVDGSSREDFDYAFKKFKALAQRERIVGQVKARMYFEKPSEKKRRKIKEAHEKRLMADVKEKLIKSGEWDRRQKKLNQQGISREERNSEVFGD